MKIHLGNLRTPPPALLAVLTALVAALPFARAIEPGPAASRTNFVQILTDDQGWGDLGCFGHPFIQSPNIDRLASEGIKFTQCYSADSVCSPSRAAILTGRTPFRNGVYRVVSADHFCHLPKDEVTLPQLLRKSGYQTAHFGKWHLSHFSETRIPGGFDYENFGFGGESAGQPGMRDYGYDYWFATGNVARPDHKDPLNFFRNGQPVGKLEGYSAQLVAAEFVNWIKSQGSGGRPFFATIWFHEPHGPVNSDPRFLDRYRKLDDASLRQYYANITQIDEAVGTIVAALKEAGAYDDTMIWYTADNGPEGQHEFGTFNKTDSPYDNSRYRGSTGGLRGRKRHTYEGGIRVPGIISWPKGMRDSADLRGSVCADPIIGSDVFPTMLEAATVPCPEGVDLDGTSLASLLRGGKLDRKRPLYWRNIYFKFQLAMREGDWKIIGDSKRELFELYNLRLDPAETTDLSGHEPERLASMKRALIACDKEVLAAGPDWWSREEAMRKSMPEKEPDDAPPHTESHHKSK